LAVERKKLQRLTAHQNEVRKPHQREESQRPPRP
jgi:hypothetical protein